MNKNDVPEEVQVLVENVAAWMIQLHEKTSLKSLERNVQRKTDSQFRGFQQVSDVKNCCCISALAIIIN